MAIDSAVLEQTINDVAGEDQELAGLLRERLGKNEGVANKFLGGFLRTSDYTKKTQAWSDERKQLEQEKQRLAGIQSEYETRLAAADEEKQRIMRDLANERISAAKANTLLQHLKEAYSLSDDDIPSAADIKQTAKTGNVIDSTADLDERFKTFKQSLMDDITKRLVPELSSMAALDVIWNEIEHDHQHLFGKRISKQEKLDLLKEAQTNGKSLESVWQDKFGVDNRRLEVRDEENKKKWREDWEKELAAKRSEEALQGIRPGAGEDVHDSQLSPLFKKNFAPQIDPAEAARNNQGNNGGNGNNGRMPSAAERNSASGAERAAVRFRERRLNGVPLGAPDPAKSPAAV